MVERIQSLLEKQGYLKIESNVPFVKLFVSYEMSSAKVIQVLDCVDIIPLTTDQYTVFCEKSKEHIRDRGYETIDFLTLIVTPWIGEARKFVLNDDHCWIINSNTGALILYDNEPDDFFGLRRVLEEEAGDVAHSQEEDSVRTSSGGYAGYYDGNPRQERAFSQEFTPVNTALVILNVLVFFIMTFMGSGEEESLLEKGAMYVPFIIEKGEYYRLFTCMFLHFGFMHLSGNMVVLMFLGDNVERVVGKIKYIIIYILGGLIGSLGSFLYAFFHNQNILSAGASGAIFAMIGALLWLVIRNKGRLEDMTTLRMCVLIAYALYNGLVSENVDMAAHLFGLIGGFLVAIVLYRKNDRSTVS